MLEADVEAVARLISNAMNADEGDQARETLDFHFTCRLHGMDDGRTYYVLADTTGIQGVVGLHRYLWGPPEIVWLAWFAVDPNVRGTGCGKRLLDYILDRATNRGYRRLYIETYSTPEFAAARRFYEAKGFVLAGGVQSYLPDGGDMVVYARELINHA
jgi:GNAT superfamily N-acetyltransferase